MKKTLAFIRREIKAMDGNLSPDDEGFKVAVVMLSSVLNEMKTAKELAAFTRYPLRFVQTTLRNLRVNGLGWQKDGTFVNSGWTGENGGLAFWMDVMVGEGLLRAIRGEEEIRK